MKRGWNANTWVLVILSCLIVLIGADLGHRVLTKGPGDIGQSPEPPKPEFRVGQTAPDFTLQDANHTPHSLAKLVNKDTVLLFNCGCSSCRDMDSYIGQLLRKMGPKAPQVINVTSMDLAAEDAWIRDTKLKQLMLHHPKGSPVMDLYHGHPCPRVYRLDKDRRITFISPSPAKVPALTFIAMDVARGFGFSTGLVKGAVAGRPEAPKFTESAAASPPRPKLLPLDALSASVKKQEHTH